MEDDPQQIMQPKAIKVNSCGTAPGNLVNASIKLKKGKEERGRTFSLRGTCGGHFLTREVFSLSWEDTPFSGDFFHLLVDYFHPKKVDEFFVKLTIFNSYPTRFYPPS